MEEVHILWTPNKEQKNENLQESYCAGYQVLEWQEPLGFLSQSNITQT